MMATEAGLGTTLVGKRILGGGAWEGFSTNRLEDPLKDLCISIEGRSPLGSHWR